MKSSEIAVLNAALSRTEKRRIEACERLEETKKMNEELQNALKMILERKNTRNVAPRKARKITIPSPKIGSSFRPFHRINSYTL